MTNSRFNHDELLKSLGLPTSSFSDLSEHQAPAFHPPPHTRNLLLCMTIDLGEGKKDVLNVYSGEDPSDLARKFCTKNHLNLEAVEVLTRSIIQNLESKEMVGNSRGSSLEKNQGNNPDANDDFYNKLEENEKNLNKKREKQERNVHKEQETVYERLHQKAIAKQERVKKNSSKEKGPPIESKRPVSSKFFQKKKKMNFSKDEQNFGVKLYLKGLKQKEEQQNLFQQKKKEQLENQEKELTFKPQLKPTKLNQFKVNRKVDSIGEHLIQMGKKNKESRDKKLAEKEKEETQGCSFRPQIDPISQKIIDEKSKICAENQEKLHSKVYERLYNNAKENKGPKKNEDEKENSEYSFKPQLISEPIACSDLPFLERMDKLQKIREEKMKLNDENKEKLDFKPKIGRAPKIDRNTQNLPIGEYLYQTKAEKEQKQKEIFMRESRELEESKARSNEKSLAIFESIKARKIEEFFTLMDSDQDGQISADKIDISSLPIFVLEKLAPMLYEMEQMNLSLDFMTFQSVFLKLINNFSVEEKNRLFFDTRQKWTERKKDFENYTFRPEINKNSIKMAEERKEYKAMLKFYEKSKDKEEMRKDKNEEPDSREEEGSVNSKEKRTKSAHNIVEITQKI